jgi:hypothetical protein
MRMKLRHLVTSTLAALALTAAVITPSHASTSYTIYSTGAYWDTTTNFTVAGCPAAMLTTPPNGIDSLIIDLKGRSGSVTLTWTGVTQLKDSVGVLGGGLSASFVMPGCKPDAKDQFQSTKPGAWTFSIPAGAQYMLIKNFFMVDVNITMN